MTWYNPLSWFQTSLEVGLYCGKCGYRIVSESGIGYNRKSKEIYCGKQCAEHVIRDPAEIEYINRKRASDLLRRGRLKHPK